MTRRQVFRGILVAAAALCLVFALFVWWNIGSDLSPENFEGEGLDFARYVWIEVNLMLLALLIAGLALLIAYVPSLTLPRVRRRVGEGERPRPRNKGEDDERRT